MMVKRVRIIEAGLQVNIDRIDLLNNTWSWIFSKKKEHELFEIDNEIDDMLEPHIKCSSCYRAHREAYAFNYC